jgi:hypothetical protein
VALGGVQVVGRPAGGPGRQPLEEADRLVAGCGGLRYLHQPPLDLRHAQQRDPHLAAGLRVVVLLPGQVPVERQGLLQVLTLHQLQVGLAVDPVAGEVGVEPVRGFARLLLLVLGVSAVPRLGVVGFLLGLLGGFCLPPVLGLGPGRRPGAARKALAPVPPGANSRMPAEWTRKTCGAARESAGERMVVPVRFNGEWGRHPGQ